MGDFSVQPDTFAEVRDNLLRREQEKQSIPAPNTENPLRPNSRFGIDIAKEAVYSPSRVSIRRTRAHVTHVATRYANNKKIVA